MEEVSTMSAALTTITDVIGTVVTTIENNGTMMAFFVAGLFGVGVSLVKRLVGRY